MSFGPGNAGSETVLSLNFGGHGPFDVPVFGVPIGYDGGIASLMAQLTVGTNIGSGLLLDMDGEPLPDGFTFSAAIFVIGSNMLDIIALNSYSGEGNGGMLSWISDDAPISPTQIQTLGGVSIQTPEGSSNGIFLNDLGTGGIAIIANGTGPAVIGATGAGSGVGISTSGGQATDGIEITTQSSDVGGIAITDDGQGGIDLTAGGDSIGITITDNGGGITINEASIGSITLETTGGHATAGIHLITQATDTGGITFNNAGSGPIKMSGLPTSDPNVVDALWNNEGVMTISAG